MATRIASVSLLLWLSAAVMCSCDSDKGPPGQEPPGVVAGSLAITPPARTLGLIDNTPTRQTFVATVALVDGATRDVTAETVFTIDSAIGTFNGADLTVTATGSATIGASWHSMTATAALVVRRQVVTIAGDVAGDLVARFQDHETQRTGVAIDYPIPGAVLPRNLGDFNLVWKDLLASDVYEITFSTATTDFVTYMRPRSMLIPGSEWGPTVADDPHVTVHVRAIQINVPEGARCNPYGGSPYCPPHQYCDYATSTCEYSGAFFDVASFPIATYQLSDADMQGGLYYSQSWASDPWINRVDLSKPFQGSETYVSATQCVGCHAIARDGSTIAMMQADAAPAFTTQNASLAISNLATGSLRSSQVAGSFVSFTPDATQLFVVDQGTITVRSAGDFSVVTTLPSAGWATHPEVSPDGTRVAYVVAASPSTDWQFTGGSIVVRPYNEATSSFGAATVLVSDANNNFAPSWSPDGAWILYTRSTEGSFLSSSSTLWVVRSDASGSPIQLAQTVSGQGDSWGAFAPYPATVDGGAQHMYWIAYQSQRSFEWQYRPTQLWMTAFFPARAMQGSDPSTPPFHPPFQDVQDYNWRPRFSERIATGLTLQTIGNGNILPGNPITVDALYRDDAGTTTPAADVAWVSFDDRLVVTNLGGGSARVSPMASGFSATIGASGRGLSAIMIVHAD